MRKESMERLTLTAPIKGKRSKKKQREGNLMCLSEWPAERGQRETVK